MIHGFVYIYRPDFQHNSEAKKIQHYAGIIIKKKNKEFHMHFYDLTLCVL